MATSHVTEPGRPTEPGHATEPGRSVGAGLAGIGGRVRTGARWVWWYLRELTGEADYDKYVEHLRVAHPQVPVPSRRDFERDKTDRLTRNPSVRCC